MNPWWKCTLVLSEANLKVRCHNIHSIRIVYKYTHKYTVKDAAERTIAERVSWLTSAHWMVNTFFFLMPWFGNKTTANSFLFLFFPKLWAWMSKSHLRFKLKSCWWSGKRGLRAMLWFNAVLSLPELRLGARGNTSFPSPIRNIQWKQWVKSSVLQTQPGWIKNSKAILLKMFNFQSFLANCSQAWWSC